MARLYNDRFNYQGNDPLVATDAVLAEGKRIRDSLTAGTYGSQPVRETPVDGGGVTPTVSDLDPNSSYGNSFFNQPSMWEQNLDPAQLRQGLRLDELKTRAALGKLSLERAQQEGPIKDAYALAQLEHERAATLAIGGTERFHQIQDANTMKHVVGFADYMGNAPEVSSPDYAPYVLAGVHQFPRVATTAWGKTTLAKIANEHDTIAGLTANVPPGYDVSGVTMGPNGPSLKLKPVGSDVSLEKDAKGFGLTLERIRNPVNAQVGRRDEKGKWVGDDTGNLVRVEGLKGAMVTLPVGEYERLGGGFSQQTIDARAGKTGAGTKHLGTYNPATGEFQ